MSLVKKDINEEKFVIFRLGGSFFGLNILQVREIMQFRNITSLPQMPDFIEGIINIRGEVVPIIDLHKRFEVEGDRNIKDCKIITVIVEEELMGLIVDEVEEVLTLEDDKLVKLSNRIGNKITNNVEEVALVDDRIIIIININKILSNQEKFDLGEISRAVDEIKEHTL